MTARVAGAAGVAAAAVFWTSLFVFAASYPGYSHSTKAISELGAFGAPHALAWNLVGFIVPGVLLAISGAGLAQAIDASAGRTSLFWLLLVSGLGFAGTGVIPAEMRDGSPFMQSPFTLGHVLMTFISGVPWVIAVFLLIGHVQRHPDWQRLKGVCVGLAALCVAGFALNIIAPALPMLSHRPGLAQRISFAIYFGWFLVMALYLLSAGSRSRSV